jgi:hypothetical protein
MAENHQAGMDILNHVENHLSKFNTTLNNQLETFNLSISGELSQFNLRFNKTIALIRKGHWDFEKSLLTHKDLNSILFQTLAYIIAGCERYKLITPLQSKNLVRELMVLEDWSTSSFPHTINTFFRKIHAVLPKIFKDFDMSFTDFISVFYNASVIQNDVVPDSIE